MQGHRERETIAETQEIAAGARGRVRPFPDFSCRRLPAGPIRPQALAAANRAALRAQIADRIVRDMAILDALDGDADLELEAIEVDADVEATAAEWSGVGAHRFNLGEAA